MVPYTILIDRKGGLFSESVGFDSYFGFRKLNDFSSARNYGDIVGNSWLMWRFSIENKLLKMLHDSLSDPNYRTDKAKLHARKKKIIINNTRKRTVIF